VASGRAKPQGVLRVPQGSEPAFLLPLPVRKLPGIGPKAEAQMLADGIRSLGDLAGLPEGPLRARYARILGVLESELAGGAGHTPFARERPAFLEHDPDELSVGSISNERTFFDALGDETQVLRELLWLVERVCWRVRKRRIQARTISLKLRYSDFSTILRSRTVSPTSEENAVLRTVTDLYRVHRQKRLSVRLLGVALSNLVGDNDRRQLLLPFDRESRVGTVIDRVRTKYGYDSVHLGDAAASWSTREGGAARSRD